MSIGVRDFRVAFLWFESDGVVLGGDLPEEPLSFRRKKLGYVERFGEVQKYSGDPDDLIPPWPSHRGKQFWHFYLEENPHRLSAWKAWSHFVPFRWKLPVDVSLTGVASDLRAEGFVYPHGHALLLSARMGPDPDGRPWSLEETVEHARLLRSEGDLATAWPDGEARELGLDTFAAIALGKLREKCRGPGGSAPTLSPYSVSTFVEVEGADPGSAVPVGGDVHRALVALSRWSHTWRVDQLPSMEAALTDPKRPAGYAHYTQSKGRAAWLPGLGRRKLVCYHRNQVLAALQVEAVAAFVRETVERSDGGPLPRPHENLARKAAGLLGRLYGGDESTYRSRTCQAQMDDRDHTTRVDRLREELDMTALH